MSTLKAVHHTVASSDETIYALTAGFDSDNLHYPTDEQRTDYDAEVRIRV
jgi:hypothetical protein